MNTFLENNFINPEIKKFTNNHIKKITPEYRCTGCKKFFAVTDLNVIKYSTGKRTYRCNECFKKLKKRV